MFKNSKFYTAFLIIFLLLFIYSVYDYYQNKIIFEKEAIVLGNSKRDETKDILNNAIDTIQIVTFDLAKKLSEKKYSKEEIEKIIRKTANENNFCIGITVAFKPRYDNDSIKQFYAPYYSKKSDDIKYLENFYDYTDKSLKTSQWYTKVIEKKAAIWSNPYIGQVAQELILDYGIPFFEKDKAGNKRIAGMVSCTVSASYIASFLHDITLGNLY